MIAQSYELYCDLSSLNIITGKIAMQTAADASAEFRAALCAFRASLVDEQERIGRSVEFQVRAKLAAKGRREGI